MRKYIAIIIASLALFTGQAHAQRCLPKMQGIEVRANMADGFNPGGNDGGYSFGAALSTYTKKGNKWVFGGEYLLKNNPYRAEYAETEKYQVIRLPYRDHAHKIGRAHV